LERSEFVQRVRLTGALPLAAAGKPFDARFFHGAPCAGVAHAGDIAVSGGGDGTARVWETATGICRHVFAGHAPAVSIACTSFSVCGTVLLTIGTDGSALAWDAVHGGPPRPLTGPGGGAAGGRLAPDGARALLWSAPGAGGASVWLLATHGAPVRIAEAAQAPAGVSATAWSPCGRAASLGAPDGTLRVLRAADGAPTGFFMADAAVTAAAFVGAVAVAGCDDGAVHFLDVGGLDE
jgi:WD40 repeat protein